MKVGPPLNMAMFLVVFIHQSSNTYLLELLASNIALYLFIGDFPTPWEQGEGPQVRITCLGCKATLGCENPFQLQGWSLLILNSFFLHGWMNCKGTYSLLQTKMKKQSVEKEEEIGDERWTNYFQPSIIFPNSQEWERMERRWRMEEWEWQTLHGKDGGSYL